MPPIRLPPLVPRLAPSPPPPGGPAGAPEPPSPPQNEERARRRPPASRMTGLLPPLPCLIEAAFAEPIEDPVTASGNYELWMSLNLPDPQAADPQSVRPQPLPEGGADAAQAPGGAAGAAARG